MQTTCSFDGDKYSLNEVFSSKAIFNKANNQINLSLPKKQLSKLLEKKILLNKDKKLRFKFEGFE